MRDGAVGLVDADIVSAQQRSFGAAGTASPFERLCMVLEKRYDLLAKGGKL